MLDNLDNLDNNENDNDNRAINSIAIENSYNKVFTISFNKACTYEISNTNEFCKTY